MSVLPTKISGLLLWEYVKRNDYEEKRDNYSQFGS